MSLETFIARQPIFDRGLQVKGYELLHRSGWTNAFDGRDPDQATLELLNGSLLLNRFRDLTGGHPGYINIPRNLLLLDFIEVLPPDQVVIEVLETVKPEPAVVAALRRLRSSGYRIALDDFVDEPGYDRLVQLADIIKIDFTDTTRAQRARIVKRYDRPELTFLAEKVETRKQFHEAIALGFKLFQGYFFCKPQVSSHRRLPHCHAKYAEFLREITRDDLELDRLEEIIKAELSISAKLLRYLNSAQYGLVGEIHSIKHALVHLGEQPLRRWGALMALVGMGEQKPVELLRTCLVRARFCESLTDNDTVDVNSIDLYMTGLFSSFDALTDRPLDEALASLSLKSSITGAILGDDSVLSRARELALACERNDWEEYSSLAERLRLTPQRVADLYAEAIFWADEIFASDKSAA